MVSDHPVPYRSRYLVAGGPQTTIFLRAPCGPGVHARADVVNTCSQKIVIKPGLQASGWRVLNGGNGA